MTTTQPPTVQPYKDRNSGKKEQVRDMFDNIAGKYDFLNHFLSLGIDRRWRKKAIAQLKHQQPQHLLDVACGTADLTIEAYKTLRPQKITGLDLSNKMLDIGRQKVAKLHLNNAIELLQGDSEHLPFADASFDAVTVAFGVRNFENLQNGLTEMYRVLRKGGQLVVLEFSRPRQFPFKQLYGFYFFHILPFWGRLFSKDQAAYSYLPESVQSFPDGKDFLQLLENSGFTNCRQQSLTLGVVSIYTAVK